MEGGLGRRVPADWNHVDKYPLSALATSEQPTKTPVAIGVNWYTDFDTPEKIDGRWWIAKNGIRGRVRGGHCVCLKPGPITDLSSWWLWYDQGQEGACVGYGVSRMMSLLNRKRYFARWLWDHAKMNDDWKDTNPGDDNGTSVRAACEILRASGHVRWMPRYTPLNQEGNGSFVPARDALQGVPAEGVSAYRWARNVDEVRAVCGSPLSDRLQAFQLVNSWGRSYPHVVMLPYVALTRLIDEDGEVAICTDR